MRTEVCIGLKMGLYIMGMAVMGYFQLACKALGYTKKGPWFMAFEMIVVELLRGEITLVLEPLYQNMIACASTRFHDNALFPQASYVQV